MTQTPAATGSPASRQRSRRVVINRAPEPSEVQRRLEDDRRRYPTGMVDPDQFAAEIAADFARHGHGGRNAAVASISVFEVPGIRHRYGPLYVFDRISELIDLLHRHLAPNDVFHVAENGDVLVLGRDSPIADTFDRVDGVVRDIAGRRWDADGEALLLTPSAGIATFEDGDSPAVVIRRAIDAREVASGHLDLRVHRWEPAMSSDTAPPDRQPFTRFRWQAIKERLRAPSQILATYVLGLILPFCLYWFFDQVVGFDISWGIYMFCVSTLVSTGVMILVEARLAMRQKDPPEVDHYPDASAIICAYLPNEAATIMETLEAFLTQGYPGRLQVILAYNTPNPMAVERDLHRLADEHPDLEVVKVEGSTSKAQNVNAVLHMATGAFTGMFDADHMPRPGSFERAWGWLANGYDVVQGHCLTRNGDETFVAKMIAVEFESIYAVAHPGRAKLHRFGVFGGSNGYWRTDLLHETRMRGSMLTEDIDSSMRTVERGLKIRSDRDVVSRELGTTTMKQVWNQRLRWAQGWYQVTLMHTARVWKSPGLTFRQKCGATYLLGWREVYPWLSLQIFPLIVYWYVARGQTLSTGWPFLFFTTLFVMHVGPMQTLYAYRLADPEIKQHKSWFWAYLLYSTFFYTEYKNTIARVAHVKEWVGERAWKVTPRSDDPVEFDDDLDLHDEEEHDEVEEHDEPAARRVRGLLATWPGSAGELRAAVAEHSDLADREPPGGDWPRRSESDAPSPVVASAGGDSVSSVLEALEGVQLPRRSRGAASAPDLPRREDAGAARGADPIGAVESGVDAGEVSAVVGALEGVVLPRRSPGGSAVPEWPRRDDAGGSAPTDRPQPADADARSAGRSSTPPLGPGQGVRMPMWPRHDVADGVDSTPSLPRRSPRQAVAGEVDLPRRAVTGGEVDLPRRGRSGDPAGAGRDRGARTDDAASRRSRAAAPFGARAATDREPDRSTESERLTRAIATLRRASVLADERAGGARRPSAAAPSRGDRGGVEDPVAEVLAGTGTDAAGIAPASRR